MVGGSELAYRLLCRKYGTTLAYTPMINSNLFAVDPEYRAQEFQTNDADRPLVAHFGGNDPEVMLAAARFVEDRCDAVDLNLGCPQRIAHAGHFGSFLLDNEDRDLVVSIVKNLSTHLSVPVFVKIRLLDSVEDTLLLCTQLIGAGASLIAIHARYRVNLVGRTGPGARDGAAHLDQVKTIKEALSHTGVPIISNGNVREWADVQANRSYTGADGIMVAEAILDNPAIFAPSLVMGESSISISNHSTERDDENDDDNVALVREKKKRRSDSTCMSLPSPSPSPSPSLPHEGGRFKIPIQSINVPPKLELALEYLDLAEQYPVKVRSIIFHTRRICKDDLLQFQLLEECINAKSLLEVRSIVQRAVGYRDHPDSFAFDREKELLAKEAFERRKREEGRRKEFEARMIRKAKREGKELDFYLSQGAEIPTVDSLADLKAITKEAAFEIWKKKHSQHCFNYHFEPAGCHRERTCSFLHSDIAYTEHATFG